ncbi:MAG: thioesterase family protein [Desulfobacterium sp.]|nr:thioesterase family protein [Desulfobacterium sp.]
MKKELEPGFTFTFEYQVPEENTVPFLFPEMPECQEMPRVFATGYLVGLFELACIKAINPFINWPAQQTVGIHINISHEAATPPGMTITVQGTVTEIKGKKLCFSLTAFDGVDQISQGTHERFIINAEKFNTGIKEKEKKQVAP